MSASCRQCRLIQSLQLSETLWQLQFDWQGTPPEAGQFFMLKADNAPVFLPRPFGAAGWNPAEHRVSFIVDRRGSGTAALCAAAAGAQAELTGPLGNGFAGFLPPAAKKIALVAGGTGIAPLVFWAQTLSDSGKAPDFYAGFKKSWNTAPGMLANLGKITACFTHVSEEGITSAGIFAGAGAGKRGLITDWFNAAAYDMVFCCGPEILMQKIAAACSAADLPCCLSLEKKMACGVGACLGCTIHTKNGNRRCCADGPVFNAKELNW